MKDIKSKLIKKLSHPAYADHKINFSRRDFMRYGLISAGASFIPLTPIERAIAAVTQKPRIPFLTFDLMGGAALTGNFLVGQKGGPEDFVNDYIKMGWNPRNSTLDHRFGLPMNAETGQIHAGLKQTLPQSILATEKQNFLKMTSMCHFSISDNQDNDLSAITLISKAGSVGRYETNGVGPMSTNSGGYSNALLKDAMYRPKAVSNIAELLALPRFSAEFENMPESVRKQTINGLVKSAGKNKKLKDIYSLLINTGTSQPDMNPKNNQAFYSLYPIEDTRQNSEIAGATMELQAGIVYNVLTGNTGPGVVQITDCDYHMKDQPELGAAKDLEIGQAIGRAIHAASVLNTPLFFQIISDGGITSPANYEMVWDSDANEHTLSIMGYFDPTGKINQQKLQLGHYTAKGEVEIDSVMGMGSNKNTEMMVNATLLNYLSVQGLTVNFDTISNRLPDGTPEQLLAFT